MTAAEGRLADAVTIRPGRSDPPEFAMPATWARDGRLSLAALGLLARIAERIQDGVRVGDIRDLCPGADPGPLVRELRRAGYLAEGKLQDPFLDDWHAGRRRESPGWYQARPTGPHRRPDLVYYIRRARDGAVKIGHSVDVRGRLAGLGREYGDVTCLAAEPGGKRVETERHRQFAHLRLPAERTAGGGEWFRFDGALAQYVAALGKAAG